MTEEDLTAIHAEPAPTHQCKTHGAHSVVMQIKDNYDVWSVYCLICLGNHMTQTFGTMLPVERKDGDK